MIRIGVILIAAARLAQAAPSEAREWKAPDGSLVKYRWSTPASPDSGRLYPLILFLHGSGERGSDNKAQLTHGVLPILQAAEKLGQPGFLVAPQCPADRWWSSIDPKGKNLTAADQPNDQLDPIIALIETIMAKYPVDPHRFYVTGISMGGFATWDLLGRMPGKIAAAVPICGGGDPSLAVRYKDVPIHAFHGELDTAVPVAATRDMIAALEKAGGKPKVTIYPGVDHVCWTKTYEDLELYRWIFAQRKRFHNR